jgi:hypothetical protein
MQTDAKNSPKALIAQGTANLAIYKTGEEILGAALGKRLVIGHNNSTDEGPYGQKGYAESDLGHFQAHGFSQLRFA